MTQMYVPKKIYLDPAVTHSPITENILNKFPNTPLEVSSERPKIFADIKTFADPLSEGKKHLWITRNPGKLIKKCGAATSTLNQMVCCNYFILDFSFNCHFECVYCYLQEYLQHYQDYFLQNHLCYLNFVCKRVKYCQCQQFHLIMLV